MERGLVPWYGPERMKIEPVKGERLPRKGLTIERKRGGDG